MAAPFTIVQRRLLPALALAVLLADVSATGCSSKDRHEFHSTPLLPTSVSVYDVVHERTLWAKDIPVRHTLLVDFDRGDDSEIFRTNTIPATRMTWWLYPEGAAKGRAIATSQVTLPGSQVMLKVAYRPSPEYPHGEGPPEVLPQAPVPPPAAKNPLLQDEPPTAPPPIDPDQPKGLE